MSAWRITGAIEVIYLKPENVEGHLGEDPNAVTESANFLTVFHSYASILLSFRDMTVDGQRTDVGNHRIMWPLKRANNSLILSLLRQTMNYEYSGINPLMRTLKPQSNGPLYSNTVTGRLIHWPLTDGLLHLVQREVAWAGCGPA